MKRFAKNVCLLIIVCTGRDAAFAQDTDKKTEYLQLQPKQVTINSSIFSKVEVIDTRYDTAHIGFVQRGGLNRKVHLKFARSMADEITSSVTKLIDSANKQDNTILINIRNFFLSEFEGSLSENGKFIFKAGYYLKQDTIYREMYTLDTVIIIKGGFDVSEKLLDSAKEAFGAFVKQAASFDPAQCNATKTFTAYDIQHIDELEKKGIPVYNVEAPKKGIYATFEDFKNNRPSSENVLVENRKGFSRPFVYELKENGKKGKEILRKYYYVVSDGEKMFISRPNNLYPITKTNGDFYFTGVGKDVADVGTVVVASALFGILGGAAAASHDTAIFEFRIDHVTGRFIPVRKIKD